MQSGRVTQRCHNSLSWETESSKCEWRHAPEARGGFWEILKKSVSWDETCFGGRRLFFACSRRPLWRVPHVLGVGRWKSQNRKIVPLSPYVEKPLNSKVINGFVPELRIRYVLFFFEFRDSYVLSLWAFDVHFTHSHIIAMVQGFPSRYTYLFHCRRFLLSWHRLLIDFPSTNCSFWFFTPKFYTRMLWAILNKSWRQHPTIRPTASHHENYPS